MLQQFGEEYRPCKLTRHVVSVPRQKNSNDFQFAKILDYKLFETLQLYSSGEYMRCFCTTACSSLDREANSCVCGDEKGCVRCVYAGIITDDNARRLWYCGTAEEGLRRSDEEETDSAVVQASEIELCVQRQASGRYGHLMRQYLRPSYASRTGSIRHWRASCWSGHGRPARYGGAVSKQKVADSDCDVGQCGLARIDGPLIDVCARHSR